MVCLRRAVCSVEGVNCFIVCGCAFSSRYINVCNSDVFGDVNMYIGHLKFFVVCINGRTYVRCSKCYVVYHETHPDLFDYRCARW